MSEPILRTIFVEALELQTPEDRTRYLNKACGSNIALRQQVETLLRAHEAAGAFLSDPSKCAPGAPLPGTEKVGDLIGRYKLLQQIGEGGCGIVYLAEQEEPVKRRVALKVIKFGMDTKQVVARFEAERQALALMDHPNIAKVLDAGAAENGRPYFVMELVRGIRVTEYCDRNKLTTDERLKVFLQICQAIQHAHQKGVIHRDIKPSNILVTINDGIPVPKVIDFGIAKATQGKLTDHTLFTAFEQFIGTPAYMSPEQAVMTSQDIDTRSDIYSLGILLYELLTGRPPFDQKDLVIAGLDEMRRTIREKEPPKPSTRLTLLDKDELTTTAQRQQTDALKLVHRLRGDLDWIVMKCLEKDRARRYETASGLGADLQRHLDDEPVTARPPGQFYKFQKTVRRHKFGFAAATALVLSLLLGVVGSAWQALRATKAEREQTRLRMEAEREKNRAEMEAARSKEVSQFLTLMLESAGPRVAAGRDVTLLNEILSKAGARIEMDLTNQPEVRGDLWMVLGRTYADIGERTNAIRTYQEAVNSYQQAFRSNHTKLAVALGSFGSALSYCGRITEGRRTAALGLEMARALGNQETLAACLSRYALSFRGYGQGSREAEPFLREAIAIRETIGSNESLMNNYSSLANSTTNVVEAEVLARRVLNYSVHENGEDHPDTAYQHFILAQHLIPLHRISEASDEFKIALAGWRKFFPPNHPHRAMLFRFFIETLLQQNRLQDIYTEFEAEQKASPTNDYVANLKLALKIRTGELPIAPPSVLEALEETMELESASFDKAIMLARNGRKEEYRQCCQALIDQAAKQGTYESAEQAAKAALLFPTDPKLIAAAGKLADFALENNKSEFLMQWGLSTKALAEYRRGNFTSAIDLAARSLSGKDVWRSSEATAHCIEALANVELGKNESARAALAEVMVAAKKYREEILKSHWEVGVYWGHRDWIMAGFLQREAEERLKQNMDSTSFSH